RDAVANDPDVAGDVHDHAGDEPPGDGAGEELRVRHEHRHHRGDVFVDLRRRARALVAEREVFLEAAGGDEATGAERTPGGPPGAGYGVRAARSRRWRKRRPAAGGEGPRARTVLAPSAAARGARPPLPGVI